jgi:hypothetical protein
MPSSIRRSIVTGVTRALSARRLILTLWLINLLAAAALAVPLGASLQSSIGASLVHERLRAGFDMGWFGELQGTAQGLLSTFTPTVVGAGAFLNNLEAWLTGDLWRGVPAIVVAGSIYLLLWTFLQGGILMRLSLREEGRSAAGFFASSGRFFVRFLGLAVMSGVLYAGIYRLGRWLFPAIEQLSRDVTVERPVLLLAVGAALLIALLLCLVNLVFDYARLATVVEGRRNPLRAAYHAFRLVLRNPRQTLGLYLIVAAAGLLLLAIYARFAPGALQSTVPGIVLAFVGAQVYLVVKLVLRLVLYGSQLSLYQSLLPALAAPPADPAVPPP